MSGVMRLLSLYVPHSKKYSGWYIDRETVPKINTVKESPFNFSLPLKASAKDKKEHSISQPARLWLLIMVRYKKVIMKTPESA